MFYIWTLYWVFEIQCVFDSYSLSQLHWLHFKCSEHHLWFIATVLASARSKTFSLGFLGSSCYFTVRGLYACWLFPVDSWLLRDVREGCCLGLVGGACWAGFWCPGWFIGGRMFQWAYRGGTGVTCVYKRSRGCRAVLSASLSFSCDYRPLLSLGDLGLKIQAAFTAGDSHLWSFCPLLPLHFGSNW